ncbi:MULTISPECIES: MerR family transcriptional regulator [unclassified Micromonospora]|uniref:transcriptional regulator FtsR n=1 Tax=Micromonospora TaxID=1873 RepID=UPI0022B62EB2|nr:MULTISPECIES: MerR family transcriptional regulator [unclassified Micromonospora]MCZ7423075.1 MerR family transcriptional regulator [Verrucosispora sp. WMMA2121]WBB50776.1 MerR family transcriptional regulator [Verrucosispora sp. WMMA2044]WBB90777.1 MerR family transcriptional regulator [Verrucosispora sp. WMMC514]
MSIGEVLAQLRADFPDVTISKLRFLEAEGLVEPQRTAAGYRKYGWDDVARLRFVLTAQRDQYLPLRVIREQLARWDTDGEVPEGSRPALVAVGPDGAVPGRGAASAVESAQVRLDRAELVARSGLDESTLGELERLGLVVSDPPGWYDGDALIIARAVAGLAAYGFQPRHLRGYRTAADREVGLFAQLVAPLVRQSDPAARARAAETARELVALSQQLHAALVRVGLRSTLGR